jgi:hypothetical protein
MTEENESIIAKYGLLWRNGKIIGLPEADIIARERGFNYAEELVKHLVESQDEKD